MRWIVAAVLLGGCTHAHEVSVSLPDLADATLAVHTSADARTIDIKLEFAMFECPKLDAAVMGTLDGMPLEVISRGGYIGGVPSCETIWFTLFGSPSSAAPSEIALTDGVTMVTATTAGLRAVRAFSLVGTPHVGADERFAWSVPTDTVQSDGVKKPLPGVLWTPIVGPDLEFGPGFGQGGVTLDGTTLIVSIPTTAASGAGTFDFLELLGPTFTSCVGFGRCVGVPPVPGPVDVTLAP